jgi:hypothetical protein|tara:strand:+ start:446 stop:652 length:207 start_codon:yes stop_codon:yes gene_type:complete
MPIDISLDIEKMVSEKKITYMEAVLLYTEDIDGEIEMVSKLLNKSIKDKIEYEAQELNMLKKTGKLPL